MEYMGHIMEYSGNTIHVNERKKNMEWMGRQWQPLNEQIVFFSGILPWVNAITIGS